MRRLTWFLLSVAATSCGGSEPETGPIQCANGTQAFIAENGNDVAWWCADLAAVATGSYLRQIDGVTVTTGTFESGRPSGDWVFLQPTSEAAPYARLEASYADGVPDGIWIARDEMGTQRYRHTWNQGAPCGIWTDVLDDGTSKETAFPTCTGEEPTDPLFGYPRLGEDDLWDGQTCPSDTKLIEFGNEHFCADSQGTRQGPWARLTAGAVVLPIEVGQYSDGLKTGIFRRWHGNGIVAETSIWAGGLLDGAYISNHPTGHFAAEGTSMQTKRAH